MLGAFNPATGQYQDQQGNPLPDARPIPTASQAAGAGVPQSNPDVAVGLRPASELGGKTDPATGMSYDALYQAGLRYAIEGKMPPLGQGRDPRTQARRDAIQAWSAGIARNAGMDLPEFRAEYDANQKSLGLLTRRYDATKAFADQAAQTLTVAEKISGTVSRGDVRQANRIKNWLKGEVSDQNLSRFEYAIYTAARDVAKVTTGGSESVAALTDGASAAVDRLLNAAMSPQAFQAVLGQMRVDIANYMEGLRGQRDQVRQRIKKLSDPLAPDEPEQAPPAGGVKILSITPVK
jgi:hypothetical protein